MANNERYFGFMLKDVSRRYVSRFEHSAAGLGLTLPHCKILVYLSRHEGLSQARLTELTDLEPMTVVRLLDVMERDGLIERRSSTEDRRIKRVFLCPQAEPALAEIWRIADCTRAEAFSGFTEQEKEHFFLMMERIQKNLQNLASESSSEC